MRVPQPRILVVGMATSGTRGQHPFRRVQRQRMAGVPRMTYHMQMHVICGVAGGWSTGGCMQPWLVGACR